MIEQRLTNRIIQVKIKETKKNEIDRVLKSDE